ncbi:MAG: recombination protein RecR, partial [Lachnospiraceae bacterium]|nr:recombination protein RecR [Lachnospiraceae bacterium]
MEYYSKQISNLISELSTLPGIGAKSAQRLAFHLLNMPEADVEKLATSMIEARRNIHYCKNCFTLTDQEICPICSDAKRNKKL